ncbi:MAG: hypothetical protein P1V36_13800 [Planctomycetota bacterium]|nr:hypothetical protein [Planctomycetota bacterium]
MRVVLPLLLATLVALAALLAACGEDPAPTPPPTEETWFLAPVELGRLILTLDTGGLAWLPPAALEQTDMNDLRQLKAMTELLGRTVIARLTLRSDASYVLDLRAEGASAAWRTVKATGTWAEEPAGTLTLTVAARESLQQAPLEIDDRLTVRRVGTYLHLEALGRTIPLEQRDL